MNHPEFDVLHYEQVRGEFRRYYGLRDWDDSGLRIAKMHGRLMDQILTAVLLGRADLPGQEVNEELERLGSYDTGREVFGALGLAHDGLARVMMTVVLVRHEAVKYKKAS